MSRIASYYAFALERRRFRTAPWLVQELSDATIHGKAVNLVPRADARFCKEVRTIAAFLDNYLAKGAPSEAAIRERLSTLQRSILDLESKLRAGGTAIEAQLGDLVELFEYTSAFEPPSKTWRLDDPVRPLKRLLHIVKKRLEQRLAEPTGGRPTSPKYFAVLALEALVVEYSGSCSKRELSLLARALLEPVLIHHSDFTDIGYYVRKLRDFKKSAGENHHA